ncbi:TPA: hypothetical protein U2L42_000856 [Citrobacter amalonaticus]|jgi:hypothetical protein|uniref:Uncharacterized protein n=1 Tax=Citrobacter amalonaticus TaxID=35703 RepID=A0A6N2W7M2_CITAM|nr:hypothetical protein [Citrobacter amalonaticus]GJK85653.1 hypothetical protein TUM17567_19480 [Citrobacter amalonaticus]HEM7919301.1 hypothetical protein [Citrobacter amalonaticus]
MEQLKIRNINNSWGLISVPENYSGRGNNLIRTNKKTAPMMRSGTGKAQYSDRADTCVVSIGTV